MAGSFTNWAEAQILNHLFGGIPWSPLSTLYFGYMVGQPQETGAGVQFFDSPSGGNYLGRYALPVAMSVVLNSIPEIGPGTILITLD